LIDDSERRTLAIILPVVKQVECHLVRLEPTIENKGLMGVLHDRGEVLRALDPILWIESIQDFEPRVFLLYSPRHA